jgi:DNA-3-methyladenine glycosylase II
MQIPFPEFFSYELCLSFLRRSPREVLHRVEGDRVIKALRIGDQVVIVRITEENRSLRVSFLDGEPLKKIRDQVRDYILEWFDMDTDLKPFYSLARRDELLKDLIMKFHGYRIIGQPDLFESLVWAVLGQQINLQFAYTLKQRFVQQFGGKVHFDENDYFLFPEPRLVATLNDNDLLPLQFSRQKSKYVRLIGEAFAGGSISKEILSELSFDDAKTELMKIKGIGNWTANYALMKTFRYPNAFPLEDAGLHNAIKNLKGMRNKPSIKQVQRIFKHYVGWEAYATLYLWKSLSLQDIKDQ